MRAHRNDRAAPQAGVEIKDKSIYAVVLRTSAEDATSMKRTRTVNADDKCATAHTHHPHPRPLRRHARHVLECG